METIEEGYYLVNGKKNLMYFDGAKWRKPAKDFNKRYSGHVSAQTFELKIKSLIPVLDPNKIWLSL